MQLGSSSELDKNPEQTLLTKRIVRVAWILTLFSKFSRVIAEILIVIP